MPSRGRPDQNCTTCSNCLNEFEGPLCDKCPLQPGDCGEHGFTNIELCKCNCIKPWTGPRCSNNANQVDFCAPGMRVVDGDKDSSAHDAHQPCASCQAGSFLSHHECAACPAKSKIVFIVIVLSFCAVAPLLYLLSKSDAFVYFQLGLLFLQINSMFMGVRAYWSALVDSFTHVADLFTFIVPSIHCVIDMPQYARFFGAMALPFVVAFLCAAACLVVWIRSHSKRRVQALAWRTAGIFLVVMYVPLSSRALSVFHVVQTESGARVLAAYADVESGTFLYWLILSIAVLFIAAFTIGAPLLLVRELRRGTLVRSNGPLHFLVHHFTPRCRWWEVLLLATKLGVVLASKLIPEKNGIPLVVSMVWLLIIEALYIRFMPFTHKRPNWSFIIVLGCTVAIAGLGIIVDQVHQSSGDMHSGGDSAHIFNVLWIVFLAIASAVVASNMVFEVALGIRSAWKHRHHAMHGAENIDAEFDSEEQVALLDELAHD